MLMHNIQRVIQEGERMKKEIFEKVTDSTLLLSLFANAHLESCASRLVLIHVDDDCHGHVWVVAGLVGLRSTL